MYILQNVHYVRRSDLETDDLECIWIEVIPEHGKNVLVASGYRHSTYSDFFDRFFPILDKANETNLEIFVLGDLNCDRLKEHSLRDKIDFFMQVYGLSQLVTEPTRITDTSSTLIDVILTTIPYRCTKTDGIHTSYSDHSLVYTTISGKGISKKECFRKCQRISLFQEFF